MLLVRICIATSAICCLATARAADHDQILVRFKSGSSTQAVRQSIRSVGAYQTGEISQINVRMLRTLGSRSQALQALRHNPHVEFAEADGPVPAAQTSPNDPYYASWQNQLRAINAPAAWSRTTGDSNLVVAVIDSGVNGSHTDLINKMVPGKNLADGSSNTGDSSGHGTSVAGVIGASTNNGAGVASVAWNVRLMPLKVTDSNGTATYGRIASAITYAADHGARVANASYATLETSATVATAANYLFRKGGILTASAGNSGATLTSADNPEMLLVSAIDGNNVVYSWSCYGKPIDVCAPGTAYTTFASGGYGVFSGTSCAAPTVAGVVALTMSANPSLSPSEVVSIIKGTAKDLGAAGWDPYYGSGCVDAGKAVEAAGGGTTDSTPPKVSIAKPIEGATISGIQQVDVIASDDRAVASVRLYVDGELHSSGTSTSNSWSLDTTKWSNGNHRLVATAADAAGNESSSSVNVSFQNQAADSTPPTIQISSPTGGNVRGSVKVTVDARDNVGVAKVELYVDGRYLASSNSAPFTITWSTRKYSLGDHTLQAVALDHASNRSASQIITVRVTK